VRGTQGEIPALTARLSLLPQQNLSIDIIKPVEHQYVHANGHARQAIRKKFIDDPFT